MLRHCLFGRGQISERRCISACSNLLKNVGGDDNGNKDDPSAKLNALLLSIAKEDTSKTSRVQPVVQVPKPRLKQRLKKLDEAPDSQINLGSRIVEAAKKVSDKMDGNQQEIEAQLLQKLLFKNTTVKNEILKASDGNKYLSDLLSKMDVEKEPEIPSRQHSRTEDTPLRPSHTKNIIGRKHLQKPLTSRKDQRVNLFGEKPLGIFTNTSKNQGVLLKTWTACEEREKVLSVTHPPSNYFEQMIDWTEKGIIWKFPIDNEQGLEEEKNVSFASHVLLENHLEGWCPNVGPIRHFMELVCVGLSRNHWLSSQEKKDHIMWYKEFFTEHKELIKELGAGDLGVQENQLSS